MQTINDDDGSRRQTETPRAIDPDSILGAMGVTGVRSVDAISGGWDTGLWRVTCNTKRYALRVFRPNQEDRWRHEQLVHQITRRAGLPVPAVEHAIICDGLPAMLLDWCEGRPLLTEMLHRPWRVWTLGKAFGRLQARIHAVRVDRGLFHEEAYEWIAWAGPEEEGIQERLRRLTLRGDSLLHLDYHPLNVIVNDGAVTAVLDWANARVGDPRADFARTLAILRLAPAPPGRTRWLVTPLRRTLQAAWRRGYQAVEGPLQDMDVFYAWAGAVMMRDLTPQIGRPGVWLRREDLETIRQWTARWKRSANIGDGLSQT